MQRPIKIYSGVGVVKESSRQSNFEGCSSLPYVECMEEGEYEGFWLPVAVFVKLKSDIVYTLNVTFL